jgi:hypothetical protein
MAVDLKSNTTFQRVSILLTDNAIVKLEHERTQDRIRRFPYESIQAVLIWQRISWWRIVLCTIVLIFPGIGIAFNDSTTALISASILIGMGLALDLWYLYCKVTTVRIVRGHANYDLIGLFRPGKLRKFRQRLLAGIDATQAAAMPPDGPPKIATTS